VIGDQPSAICHPLSAGLGGVLVDGRFALHDHVLELVDGDVLPREVATFSPRLNTTKRSAIE